MLLSSPLIRASVDALCTGTAEAVYERSGSASDPGLRIAGAEQCGRRAQRLRVSGGMPPRKFSKFRRIEIDFGAFWDVFPAWQGTRTNCKSVTAAASLLCYACCTLTQNDRSNSALYGPLSSTYNSAELQACERPDEKVVGCAAAVHTRELPRKTEY